MSETLGKRIASLRKKADLTQEELAEKLDVSPQAVSKWENDMVLPRYNAAAAAGSVFGMQHRHASVRRVRRKRKIRSG